MPTDHDWAWRGAPLAEARKVLVMVHGRGANAADILSLTDHLRLPDFAVVAPEAPGHSWYPHSFLVPPERNEPYLSEALVMLEGIENHLTARPTGRWHAVPGDIYWLGFSQGACLVLEYTARHAQRYGGVLAMSGGLIGDQLAPDRYQGDFEQTPIFLGCSDRDPHIPLQRVRASTQLLREMGAAVTEKIYPDMPHTINQDEIDFANQLLNRS